MADQDTRGLHEDFEFLKGVEQRKNEMIEELLKRLDNINHEYQLERLDYAREKQFNRDMQLEKRSLQLQEQRLLEEIRGYKTIMERGAFILVLIDGDGMIFDDDLIKRGELGGEEAALSLSSSVREYARRIPALSSDFKIVTRIYANLKGLGNVCHKAGILDTPSTIEDFARGFTGSKHLFDFVDVGMGKDRADEKISEMLKLDLYNVHCRHILFGCSHDNGYARLLQDVGDRQNIERITLLEGVPFERELLGLVSKYPTTKFEGLFRTSKINIYQQQYTQSFQVPYQSTVPSQPIQQSVYSQPAMSTPLQATPPYHHVQPQMQAIQRPPSTSINGSTAKMNPTAPTWASTAVSGPPQVASPPPTPQPNEKVPRIERNKYGQRIDPPFVYDKDAFKRMRQLHLCQNHFLRECQYGNDCSNRHDYKPNKNELQTLKGVARSTPCKFGTECDDAYCYYGHRCPLSIEGRRDCFWENNCWFSKEMHGIDLKPVHVTKVGK